MLKNISRKHIYEFFITYHQLLIVVGFYFFIRFINLTILPIFNDESIYLNWGQLAIAVSDNLFHSLYDGKQPFMIWMFGLSQHIFTDQLFAGRFVSVVTGFLSLIGLYMIASKIYSKKVALFASILYCIVPLFSFYDRLALMESSIAAIGLWLFYFTLLFIENPSNKTSIYIAVTIALGLFIKTTAALFLFPFSLIMIHEIVSKKSPRRTEFITYLAQVCVVAVLLLVPLVLQRDAPKIITLNNRFSYTLPELIAFPIKNWLSNFFGSAELLIIFLTPVTVLALILGIVAVYKLKERKKIYSLYWFLMPLFVFVLTVRAPSSRYIIALLPLGLLFSSYYITSVLSSRKQSIMIILAIVVPFVLTAIQIINPQYYFNFLSNITKYSDRDAYITSWTSGYGVKEAVSYLKSKAKTLTIIMVRVDSGNPEDAMMLYFRNSVYVKTQYFEKSMTPFSCIKSDMPVFFVSRDNQLDGLEKTLTLKKKFLKPSKKHFVGIYALRTSCKGKTLFLE